MRMQKNFYFRNGKGDKDSETRTHPVMLSSLSYSHNLPLQKKKLNYGGFNFV